MADALMPPSCLHQHAEVIQIDRIHRMVIFQCPDCPSEIRIPLDPQGKEREEVRDGEA
jgi:hypothetical protein